MSTTASPMRIKRSPRRSMARPSSGLNTIPMRPPANSNEATIWVGCLKMVTSTQGEKVRKICLRVPYRMLNQ